MHLQSAAYQPGGGSATASSAAALCQLVMAKMALAARAGGSRRPTGGLSTLGWHGGCNASACSRYGICHLAAAASAGLPSSRLRTAINGSGRTATGFSHLQPGVMAVASWRSFCILLLFNQPANLLAKAWAASWPSAKAGSYGWLIYLSI